MDHVASRSDVRRWLSKLLAVLMIVGAGCATEVPLTALDLSATGLGPCTMEWYVSCNYGIRVEGAGGYDHRGTFAWDQGAPPAGQMGHGTNGPVASTGVSGDVGSTLPPGDWTISFRLWYGSDAIQLVPVPGGTPREREEDPFIAACSTHIETEGVTRVELHVAFQGSACTIETLLDAGTARVVEAPRDIGRR
jgi:hypothetical protein